MKFLSRNKMKLK